MTYRPESDFFQNTSLMTYEGFRCRALDDTLSRHEKIGAPDSPEMLAALRKYTGGGYFHAVAGKFPQEFDSFIAERRGTADAVVIYGVLMMVCVNDSIFNNPPGLLMANRREDIIIDRRG